MEQGSLRSTESTFKCLWTKGAADHNGPLSPDPLYRQGQSSFLQGSRIATKFSTFGYQKLVSCAGAADYLTAELYPQTLIPEKKTQKTNQCLVPLSNFSHPWDHTWRFPDFVFCGPQSTSPLWGTFLPNSKLGTFSRTCTLVSL